ncbi:MAG: topoisomerase II [Actinotignum schaalii]|nr:topoisomerase II [Actinotignum schaalii]
MAKKNRKKDSATPKKKRAIIPFVERPFEGLDAEAELVAMRDLLPLATMTVTLTEEYGSEKVIFGTLLPNMVGALRRTDGQLLVAMQTVMNSGDASLDIATRVLAGLELKPGESYPGGTQPEPGSPRLQDIVASFSELELQEDPAFWMTEEEAATPESQAALRDARADMVPAARIESVNGAYWCRMSREFLRWVRPEPRDAVLDGLARLRVSGEERWDDDARFIGAFRAYGLSVPVWELARGTEAEELEEPLAKFAEKLSAAIASTEPLTSEEKRARSGLVSRQVTLR